MHDWSTGLVLLLHDFTHGLVIKHHHYHAKMKHIQGSKTVPANPNDVIQMKHSKFLKIRVPESIKKRVSQ